MIKRILHDTSIVALTFLDVYNLYKHIHKNYYIYIYMVLNKEMS